MRQLRQTTVEEFANRPERTGALGVVWFLPVLQAKNFSRRRSVASAAARYKTTQKSERNGEKT